MAGVSTIPAGVPFVDALAKGLFAEAAGDPLALADMLVLLPNRRACRSLRDAFWRQGEGKALVLPAIQPIGDLDPDDLLIDAASELDLEPAIGGLRRRLMLIRLLMPLGWSADQAGRLADDLARLLDELQTERVPFQALERLVPDHLAEHWQQSLKILQILGRSWPEVLADEQALDPAERRHRTLTAIAERFAREQPARRIVAAGSTGSIPATRGLLKVIASLLRGEVVLPGVERDLGDASWQALDPQHPQFGLSRLLDFFGIDRRAVEPWHHVNEADVRLRSRRMLLRDVMQPSGMIGAWQDLPPPDPQALTGLTVAEHADPSSEAVAIALRLREALETPGRTAALVTSNRSLSRRVALELRRFGIKIDDSAGVPLDQTAPGSLLLLTARLIADGIRPVALLSVLKHPLTRADLPPEIVRRRARALDRLCLRGPAIVGGFGPILGEINGLRKAAEEPKDQEVFAELRDWLESLAGLARPFVEAMVGDEVQLGTLVGAHLRFIEGLASVDGSGEALWGKEAGEAAAGLCRELLEAAGPDDRIAPGAYPAMLGQLMAASPVRSRAPGHPRLFLWGQLEARLQQADLMILAGLNEGSWPSAEEPGPWLNPAMRNELNLPPLERRIGQAAHDFVQVATAPEVVLSRAEKDADGNPTRPSRWLVRLQTLLVCTGRHDAGLHDNRWQGWALALDKPDDPPRPVDKPAFKPPLSARPRKLSVSDIQLWRRDPYALYAKRILHLRPLEALEADPGAMERGNIIHDALEKFVRACPGMLPGDSLNRLLACGRQAFEALNHRPQVRALWWPRFLQIAGWVIAEETRLRAGLDHVVPEMRGDLVIEAPGGPFRLIARADRLERHQDGSIAVVDYKTGGLPNKPEVERGDAPQLPLEGVMIEAGAFEGIGQARVGELRYWRLTGNEKVAEARTLSDHPDLQAAAMEGVQRLIAHFDNPQVAYQARYRPDVARRGNYDHLARIGEWTI